MLSSWPAQWDLHLREIVVPSGHQTSPELELLQHSPSAWVAWWTYQVHSSLAEII